MTMPITTAELPEDWPRGTYAGRVQRPEGPTVVAWRDGSAFDMTPAFGTASAWLNEADPVAAIAARGVPITLDPTAAELLAPVDLQAIKAAGVTYVRSMLERVIEERCRGDAARAEAARAEVRAIIGNELSAVRPG